MWETLMRALQQFDAEGRARFAALTTDTERLINTKATATKFSLIAWGSLIVPYFLALASLVLHFTRGTPLPATFWLYLFYSCIWLSAFQGSVLGYVLGWGVGLYWQGKRRKAGYVCMGGGAVILGYLTLWESLLYQGSGLPLFEFVFWAFIAFSPCYLAAAGVVTWGLSLISSE